MSRSGRSGLGQAEPAQLNPFLAVDKRPLVDLDDTWQEWLGSIQRKFAQSKFVIVEIAQSVIVRFDGA
jgi:hypothetical protein